MPAGKESDVKAKLIRVGVLTAVLALLAFFAAPSYAASHGKGDTASAAKCDNGQHRGQGASNAKCADKGGDHGSAQGSSNGNGNGNAGTQGAGGNGNGNAVGNGNGNGGGNGNAGGNGDDNGGGNGNAGGNGNGNGGDQADHPGNNGTIKIDGLPYDDAPNNEPHPGCTVQVDFYNYGQGDFDATLEFVGIPPTGGGPLAATIDPDPAFIGGDPPGGGTDLDASVNVDLSSALAGITPHPKQGWHVKLTIHAPYSQGADVKHKVFWISDCSSDTSGGGSGGATGGGHHNGDKGSHDTTGGGSGAAGGKGNGTGRGSGKGSGTNGSGTGAAGARKAPVAKPVHETPPFTG
jgi:hypothetical protein